MSELSEKLGLPTGEEAEDFIYTTCSWLRSAQIEEALLAVEARDRAVVEALARWLEGRRDAFSAEGRESTYFDHRARECDSIARDIRRELLSRPEPEGGGGEGGR